MKHYSLANNETVLQKGTLSILDEEIIGDGTPAKYILTNLAFVLFVEIEGDVKTHIFDIADIKLYENEPQIIRKDKKVDVYLIGGELYLEFDDKKTAKEFVAAAKKLVGGSPLARSMGKAKLAVSNAGEAIGINLGTVATVAGNIAIDAVTTKLTEGKKTPEEKKEEKPSGVGVAVKAIGNIAKTIISSANKSQK